MAETPKAKCCWPASLRNHPHNSICWRSAVGRVCRNLLWHFLNLLSDLTPPEQRNRGVAKTSFVISWRKSLHKNCPTLEICMKKEGSKGAPIHLIRIFRTVARRRKLPLRKLRRDIGQNIYIFYCHTTARPFGIFTHLLHWYLYSNDITNYETLTMWGAFIRDFLDSPPAVQMSVTRDKRCMRESIWTASAATVQMRRGSYIDDVRTEVGEGGRRVKNSLILWTNSADRLGLKSKIFWDVIKVWPQWRNGEVGRQVRVNKLPSILPPSIVATQQSRRWWGKERSMRRGSHLSLNECKGFLENKKTASRLIKKWL